jgi:cellobiose-specific phosphotransferase system component IIC
MKLSWLRRYEAAGPVAMRKAMTKRFITLVLVALVIYVVQCVISETEAPQDIIKACYEWVQKPLAKSTPSLATPLGLCRILPFYDMLAEPAFVLHLNKT